MVREKKAKAAVLLYVAVIIILCFIRVPFTGVGIYEGCGIWNRIAYSFFHSSLLHALINVWCLLSVAFLFDISLCKTLCCLAIAAMFPVDSLSFLYDASVPTVGASGVCYAMLGCVTLLAQRKLYFALWVLGYISIGFLFPVCNVWLHLYCYLCGLFLGLLTMPIRRNANG